MSYAIQDLTKEELQQKVDSGEYKEEVLFSGSFSAVGTPSQSNKLQANINKYKYFKVVVYCGYHETFSTDGSSATGINHTFNTEAVFTRDYINKWIVDNTVEATYSVEGNFGDGTQLCITNLVKSTNPKYTMYGIHKVIGYRPTRKTIYIYKVSPTEGIYLMSSDEKILYTIDDLKLAVDAAKKGV